VAAADEQVTVLGSAWIVLHRRIRLAAMPPLVFLPGAVGSASFWQPVADRLADLGRAHVFGYPGFDGVPRDPSIQSLDDLFRWLVERLPPGPSHVIAQSMGGVLAARLAIERPERVVRLVFVAASGGVDVARLGAVEWRDDYRTALPDVPTWFVDDRTDFTDRLTEIRAPTLLVWSDADPISPPAVAHRLAGRIPNTRMVTVAGGSHAFANERPDEVASIIRSHLA
jgi:pimeloyl-ACP methyl ester carboxylesterase